MHAYSTVLRWPCGGRESGGRTRMRGPSEKNAQYWECAMRQYDDKLGDDARKQGSGIFFPACVVVQAVSSMTIKSRPHPCPLVQRFIQCTFFLLCHKRSLPFLLPAF